MPQPQQYPFLGPPQPPQQGLALANNRLRGELEAPVRSQTQLIVGVDFGTTFSGVAFGLIVDQTQKEEVITEWPGAGTDAKQKISTVIRYNEQGEVVGWGALQDGLNHQGRPLQGIQQLNFFKLHLGKLEGYDEADLILKPLPEGKTAVNVISDYLRVLREAAVIRMRKTLGELYDREERNIRYFLTVPAIWDDGAKASMRIAAAQAGFVEDPNDRRLNLISEPEAAAMYCAKSDMLDLRVNDALLIVDCGGGTVDLIAYQVDEVNPLSVSECTPGSGALVGSGWLNRGFYRLVMAKLERAGLHQTTQPKTMGRIINNCLEQFDTRIKGNFKDDGTTHICDVGLDRDIPEADIEDGQMMFNNDEVLSIFHPIVSRILTLVRNQIELIENQNKNLSNILLIGGFGASNYLYDKIKQSVPPQYSNKVVRPMDAVSAIVRGALTAGITERLITSRVARKHYLMATLEPFVEGVHREEYRTSSLDGKDRCRNCHQVYVQKGERLHAGHRKKLPYFRLVPPGAVLVYEDILYVCESDVVPKYITDPGIKEYVTLVSDLTSKNLERDFERKETPHGTFYHVQFDVDIILDGTDFVAEVICQGEVMGRCTAKFR
ncbi:hypothetical protein KEM52_005869 [Ascosphaera acerosa]|nr:hypothetical protein KEM52_005869 [Ascosphaera acerosa]